MVSKELLLELQGGRKSGQVEEMKKRTNISAIPYAGVIQVRFNGYFLRPHRHPCKKTVRPHS